jgi:hypothetical protein
LHCRQCYVERDRQGLNRLHPVFRLFLEPTKQFLICAQKRASSKTSNYLLTTEQQPTNRRSNLIVGKLRGNWVSLVLIPQRCLVVYHADIVAWLGAV